MLALDVTPQITPDNRVIMQVEIRKDSRRRSSSTCRAAAQVPSIDTKNVLTQIAVNNGDTAVIGGIYEEVIRNDIDQGAVPRRHAGASGNLFKTTRRSSREDRAADLPDAAHREGNGDVGALSRVNGVAARRSARSAA